MWSRWPVRTDCRAMPFTGQSKTIVARCGCGLVRIDSCQRDAWAAPFQNAVKMGAWAYLLKAQLDKQLLGTIRAVQAGK